jgi:tetratricopeptide (TPR) repeat protein
MANKWTEVKSKTESLCAHYFNAKTEEAKRIELEMEEGAKQAAAERDAEAMLSGHDGEGDHDNRKLPTKRRMEIVMKNKDEGTELFGDGNYTFAAARYAKALSHCGKLFDLSPEDEEEVGLNIAISNVRFRLNTFLDSSLIQVKKVKLSLHSNMALCYIKLEKHDNALQSCNEALALDPTNAKALFRRASVHHHHRKFDLAMKDLEKAEALSPDDKAVKKLKRLVDHEILKQKKKEQAMAKKMFG